MAVVSTPDGMHHWNRNDGEWSCCKTAGRRMSGVVAYPGGENNCPMGGKCICKFAKCTKCGRPEGVLYNEQDASLSTESSIRRANELERHRSFNQSDDANTSESEGDYEKLEGVPGPMAYPGGFANCPMGGKCMCKFAKCTKCGRAEGVLHAEWRNSLSTELLIRRDTIRGTNELERRFSRTARRLSLSMLSTESPIHFAKGRERRHSCPEFNHIADDVNTLESEACQQSSRVMHHSAEFTPSNQRIADTGPEFNQIADDVNTLESEVCQQSSNVMHHSAEFTPSNQRIADTGRGNFGSLRPRQKLEGKMIRSGPILEGSPSCQMGGKCLFKFAKCTKCGCPEGVLLSSRRISSSAESSIRSYAYISRNERERRYSCPEVNVFNQIADDATSESEALEMSHSFGAVAYPGGEANCPMGGKCICKFAKCIKCGSAEGVILSARRTSLSPESPICGVIEQKRRHSSAELTVFDQIPDDVASSEAYSQKLEGKMAVTGILSCPMGGKCTFKFAKCTKCGCAEGLTAWRLSPLTDSSIHSANKLAIKCERRRSI